MKVVMIAAALIFMAIPAMKVSAEPLRKEVYFTINVPFELRKSGVMLDEGKYILYQVSQNDLNLFWLYKEDKMHSPIGVVRTTRIDFSSRRYPEETMMLLDSDVERDQTIPVITGWTIPGLDGWEIIGAKLDPDRAHMQHISKADRKKGHEFARRKKEVVITVTTVNF
jgi:hypothetical protein